MIKIKTSIENNWMITFIWYYYTKDKIINDFGGVYANLILGQVLIEN